MSKMARMGENNRKNGEEMLAIFAVMAKMVRQWFVIFAIMAKMARQSIAKMARMAKINVENCEFFRHFAMAKI